MSYITQALKLKQQLDQLRPISEEQEARIMQKFRLDWNYHSNHLEGNSLTFGETKMLIMFGTTAGGKPLKDSLEITGHNEAINLILDVIKQNRPLTESFIRELHSLILKEPYWINTITADGKPTKKLIEIGKYKTSPNHVQTKTGEIFYFAKPEEAPAKMSDLMTWYQKEITKKDLNPIILAAKFHYDFIHIHPFDDGNGRTARLLMNFILMRFGFPPAIIKTDDKENYFYALRRADTSNIEPFIEYIAQNITYSLELMIKGAKGEDIEEPSDLDKKIALLDQEIKSKTSKVEVSKNKKIILNIFDNSVVRFYKKFIEEYEKFDKFYSLKEFSFLITSANGSSDSTQKKDDVIDLAKKFISENDIKAISWFYSYQNPNQAALDDLTFLTGVDFAFHLTHYEFNITGLLPVKKQYNQQLTDEEINKIIKTESEEHLKEITQKVEKI